VEQLCHVQSEARKHLAAQVGITKIYRDAVEKFDMHSLKVGFLWGGTHRVGGRAGGGRGAWATYASTLPAKFQHHKAMLKVLHALNTRGTIHS
jgi:hypothetical protein